MSLAKSHGLYLQAFTCFHVLMTHSLAQYEFPFYIRKLVMKSGDMCAKYYLATIGIYDKLFSANVYFLYYCIVDIHLFCHCWISSLYMIHISLLRPSDGLGMGVGFWYRKFYLLHLSLHTTHVSAFAPAYSAWVFLFKRWQCFQVIL